MLAIENAEVECNKWNKNNAVINHKIMFAGCQTTDCQEGFSDTDLKESMI
jgi:hypothetical protein